MSRLSQEDRETIARAVIALGTRPIADELRAMLAGPPVLKPGEVEDALVDWFGSSVKWTAFNRASAEASESFHAENARDAVLRAFLRFRDGLTNHALYDLLPWWSSYTINRRVSEMVEAGLVVECGDREDEQGKAWTARRLADAVQDYFDPPREEQGDLWS